MRRLMVLILLIVGVVSTAAGPSEALFSPLTDIFQVIQSYYLRADTLDPDILVQGAIRGMVQALDDPYSEYLTPDEYRAFEDAITGVFSGVGMEITIRDDRVTVVSPLPDTPAEAAGLLPGDWIKAVDGESTQGWTLERASGRIRGEAGTPVVLTIERADGTVFDVEITRARIRVEAVRDEYREGERVAYIRITRFDETVRGHLGGILAALQDSDLNGIVIDLRFNPGGLLASAVEAASFFVERGRPIVTQAGPAVGNRTATSLGGFAPRVPLVVLINEGTASASEIFAGAIQDYDLGVLIGRPSFGKGVVQQIVAQLADGSVLKLTTAEYFTAAGRPVHDIGLQPDILVEIDPDSEEEDPILKAALDWIAERAAQPVGRP